MHTEKRSERNLGDRKLTMGSHDLVERLKQRFDRLSDSDVKEVAGIREALIEKVQEVYGITREMAEERVMAFEAEGEDVAVTH